MQDYTLQVHGKDGTIRYELKKYQYSGQFMGERNIVANVSSPYKIDWHIGDYVYLRGEKFYLRYVPAAKKQARRGTYGEAYVYDGITFTSIIGELMDIQFLDYVYNDNKLHYTGLSNFSFYVANNDLTEFANRIKANLSRVYGNDAWSVIIAKEGVSVRDRSGFVIVEGCPFDFDDKNIAISSGTSLYNGLCLLNTELEVNFFIREIDGVKTIVIGGQFTALPQAMAYGMGRGLKSIQQAHNNNEAIITRLHAYGSTRNLPYRYYNKKYNNKEKYPKMFDENGNYLLESRYINKLMLPYSEWVLNSKLWDAYIESDRIEEIGLREGEVTFDGSDEEWDEVFPSLEKQNVDDWTVGMLVYESGYGINAGTLRTRLYTNIYKKIMAKTNDAAVSSDAADEYTSRIASLDPSGGISSYAYDYARTCILSCEQKFSVDLTEALAVVVAVFEYKMKWTDTDTTRYTHELTASEKERIKNNTYNRSGKLDNFISTSDVKDNGVSEDGTYEDGSKDTEGNVINSWFNIDIPQIGFDIEDWVDADEGSAKLAVKSGMCAGMEFEITACIAIDTSDYAKGWRLTLNRYQNLDINMVYPNKNYKMRSGDEFVLLGIDMPDIYVEAAEQRLLAQAREYLEDTDHTKYSFSLEVDSKWMAENPEAEKYIYEGNTLIINDFDAGDSMTGVGDLGLGEASILIKQLVISYNEEALPKYSITLDEEDVASSSLEEMVNAKIKHANSSVSNSIAFLMNEKLSRINDDTARGFIEFLKGLKTSTLSVSDVATFYDTAKSFNFLKSMTTGQGWGVDKDGNMQVESLEVRSALRVLELVYNRLSAEESEYVFTEGGTIKEIDPLGNGKYKCIMDKRGETDFHAFRTGDVLRGVVNNLQNLGGGEYYTVWLHVENTDAQGDNSMVVSMYADSDCPSGRNYEPTELMVVQRWGNSIPPTEENHQNEEYRAFIDIVDGKYVNRRQSCWYISSTEKRIAMLDGVNKPKLEEGNYAAFFGLPYNLSTFKGHSMNETQPYLYVRGAFLQDIHYIDYKGNVVKQERYRGVWSEDVANSIDPYVVTETTFDTVYWNNAKWQCKVAQAKYAPSVEGGEWELLQAAVDGESATLYRLTPSSTIIKRDSDGYTNVNNVTCIVEKITGSQVTLEPDDNLYCLINGIEMVQTSSVELTKDDEIESLEFILMPEVGAAFDEASFDVDTFAVPLATASVSIVSDGSNGKDGVDGKDGASGNGISEVVEEYGVSTDADVQPTYWADLESAQSWWDIRYKYLWNRETTYYSGDKEADVNTHIVAIYTKDGEQGRGIKSITNYYKSSNKQTGESRNEGTWYENPESAVLSRESKYLWNYEKILYTDNTSSYTEPSIIGVYSSGSKGERGATLRGPSEWNANAYYQSGQDGEEYIDIVHHPNYPNELFLCKVSHSGVEPNEGTIANESWSESVPWTQSDVKEFVATKFLLTEQIKTEIVSVAKEMIIEGNTYICHFGIVDGEPNLIWEDKNGNTICRVYQNGLYFPVSAEGYLDKASSSSRTRYSQSTSASDMVGIYKYHYNVNYHLMVNITNTGYNRGVYSNSNVVVNVRLGIQGTWHKLSSSDNIEIDPDADETMHFLGVFEDVLDNMLTSPLPIDYKVFINGSLKDVGQFTATLSSN